MALGTIGSVVAGGLASGAAGAGVGKLLGGSGGGVQGASTMDPKLAASVYHPLFEQFGQQLFGQPAQYEQLNLIQKLLGIQPQMTAPGTPGAFTGGQPDWAYQGQRVAGPSPLQTGAFNWAGQIPGQTQGMQQLGLGLLGGSPNFDATREYTSRLWQEDIMPGVMERFAGMGAANSGGAQQALQRAGERTALGLASQLAPMELQARQGAAAQLPGLSAMGLEGLRFTGSMGAEQRNIGQQQLGGAMDQFYESQPWSHPAMQYIFPAAQVSQQQLYQPPQTFGQSLATQIAPAIGSTVGGAVQNWLNPQSTPAANAMYARY